MRPRLVDTVAVGLRFNGPRNIVFGLSLTLYSS